MAYEDILFMQEHEADEALEIFKESGSEGLADYLSDWHFPGQHDTVDDIPYARCEQRFVEGEYIIVVNTDLPYIAMYAKS